MWRHTGCIVCYYSAIVLVHWMAVAVFTQLQMTLLLVCAVCLHECTPTALAVFFLGFAVELQALQSLSPVSYYRLLIAGINSCAQFKWLLYAGHPDSVYVYVHVDTWFGQFGVFVSLRKKLCSHCSCLGPGGLVSTGSHSHSTNEYLVLTGEAMPSLFCSSSYIKAVALNCLLGVLGNFSIYVYIHFQLVGPLVMHLNLLSNWLVP